MLICGHLAQLVDAYWLGNVLAAWIVADDDLLQVKESETYPGFCRQTVDNRAVAHLSEPTCPAASNEPGRDSELGAPCMRRSGANGEYMVASASLIEIASMDPTW